MSKNSSSFSCHPTRLQLGHDFSIFYKKNETTGWSAEMVLAELWNTNKPSAQNNRATDSGQLPLLTNGRNTAKDLSFRNQNQYLKEIFETRIY